jgi:hypothetical protein
MIKILKYLFAISVVLFLILPVLTLAEDSAPQPPLPPTINHEIQFAQTQPAQADISCDQQYPWCKGETSDIAGLVSKFYNYALAAVGVAALGAIIFGGIKYTVSAGNPSGQADAISWITGAVWGLVLLLGANLLLRTINPELVNLKMTKLAPVKVEEKTQKSLLSEDPSKVIPAPPIEYQVNNEVGKVGSVGNVGNTPDNKNKISPY